MKKIAILLCFIALFINKSHSQSACTNSDFSAGNFTDWTGSYGENDGTTTGLGYTVKVSSITAGPVNSAPSASGPYFQTIMNTPGTDPNTGGALSVIPPGGTSSCRLGSELVEACDNISYPQASQLEYSIPVTASNCVFTYQYAVVLQNPNHTASERPRFTIYILNAAGTQIGGTCGEYVVTSGSGLPGFTSCLPESSACESDSVEWKQWTTVGVDLSGYIGNTVKIQFTAFDCTPGGHFGYAYISCFCGKLKCTQQCTGTSDILTAPAGFAGYSWTIPPSATVVGTNQNLTITTPVNGTVYECTLQSVSGCPYTVYDTLNISAVNFTTTGATICAGQPATISASTGAGYSYNWSSGGNTASTTVSPTTTTTYTVTVSASGGCSNSATTSVTVNALPVAVAGPDQGICPGGSATLDASGSSGGSGPLSYQWSSPPGTNPLTVSPAVTTQYTVTVTSNGCTATDTVSVIVANHLMVTATPIDTTICPNQTVTYTASGATDYNWTGPAGTLSSTTAAVVIASPTAATTTYTVVGNSGTCTASASVVVNVVNALNLAVSPNDTICPTMSAQLTATGASSYTWSGNGIPAPDTGAVVTATPTGTTIYTVTGTAGGCSASQTVEVVISNHLPIAVANEAVCPGGTATLTAVSSATTYSWTGNGLVTNTGAVVTATPTATTIYTVNGADNGCTGSTTATVTVNPNPTIIVTPPNPSICPGASTTLTAINASTYIWNPVTGLSSSSGATVTANPTITTSYSVTGTDVNGCTGVGTINVNVAPITATAKETDAHCGQPDGSATVTAGGNCNQSFTYLWDTHPTQQTDTTAINLPAGAYIVTVSCGGCTVTATTTVNNLPGPTLKTDNIYSSTCGYANGAATVTATGNNPPFDFLWSNGQSTDSLTNVIAGTDSVMITDAVGCTAKDIVVIPNIPGPSVTVSGINPANCGISNGSATITVTGGTPGYKYNWNSTPPQDSLNLVKVPKGTYCVTVTDSNGCTTNVCVTIPPIAGPTSSTISVNEICHKANGTATVNAMGGTGHYSYTWSNGETAAKDTALVQGNYCVTVSDGGCSTADCINVGETPGPTAAFLYSPKILNILEGPVEFWNNSIGNIETWQWNYGDTSAFGTTPNTVHPYPNVGSYLVTLVVIDSNKCPDTTSDTVRVVDIFTFYIPNAFTPNGDHLNDYFAPQGTNVDPNNYNEYIYDRWGNLVFQTNEWDISKTDPPKGQAKGWNGTINNKGTFSDVVMDVYVYKIVLKEFNNGPKHEYVGKVTLVQ